MKNNKNNKNQKNKKNNDNNNQKIHKNKYTESTLKNKDHWSGVAKDTLDIIEKGCVYLCEGERIDFSEQKDHSMQTNEVYPDDHKYELIKFEKNLFQTTFEISPDTCLQVCNLLLKTEDPEKLMLLNFASAKKPGGGFLKGARAQEESIARSSSLYFNLTTEEGRKMYTHNRQINTSTYSHYMQYSPLVPVFKKDNGDLLKKVNLINILSCPAVNYGLCVKREGEEKGSVMAQNTMIERMRRILLICAEKKLEVLVLGGFGCGVFRNSPNFVAGKWKWLLNTEFEGVFRKVVFAIFDKEGHILSAFKKTFN